MIKTYVKNKYSKPQSVGAVYIWAGEPLLDLSVFNGMYTSTIMNFASNRTYVIFICKKGFSISKIHTNQMTED
jgi:hypothetical protein